MRINKYGMIDNWDIESDMEQDSPLESTVSYGTGGMPLPSTPTVAGGFGDPLIDEVNVLITDCNNFLLTDDMVMQAVEVSSAFFGIPTPEEIVISNDGTAFWNYFNDSFGDDVIHFDRHQLMSMGIEGQDALNLVMMHEAAHRMFQATPFDGLNNGAWEQELGCDFFAGVCAGMNGLDLTHFEDALGNTQGGETHPTGELRGDFIKYGRQIGEALMAQGVTPSFENCFAEFNAHLSEMHEAIDGAQTELGLYKEAFLNETKGHKVLEALGVCEIECLQDARRFMAHKHGKK